MHNDANVGKCFKFCLKIIHSIHLVHLYRQKIASFFLSFFMMLVISQSVSITSCCAYTGALDHFDKYLMN